MTFLGHLLAYWRGTRKVAAPLSNPATYERLCWDCSTPSKVWAPVTRGPCQHCGQYASLMAFEIKRQAWTL